MIFSSPSFLWALGLLAIPIIIHLFQFRRYKKLYFPDVSLLREIQTKSKTKNQLRHLLVLVSRLLILAAIILAFSEPTIPPKSDGSAQENNLVSIYLDNSLSMQNESQNTNLLQQALQDAFLITESYSRDTRFQIITNDLEATNRRLYDADGLVSEMDKIDFSASPLSINRILRFHEDQKRLHDYSESVLYLLSDFAAKTDSIYDGNIESTEIRLIQYSGDFNQNLSIDSIWLEEPFIQQDIPTKLYYTATNHGNELAPEAEISISLDGKNISTKLVSLEPNSSIDSSFIISFEKAENAKLQISITDSPIEFDNSYYAAVKPKQFVKVVEVKSSADNQAHIKTLFTEQGNRYVKLDASAIVQDSLTNLNLLIFNGVENWNSGQISIASAALEEGRNVLIIPPKSLSTESASLLSSSFNFELQNWDTAVMEVNSLQLNDPIYREVFESMPKNLNYPRVNGHWQFSGSNFNTLMTLYNGDALLASSSVSNGSLFVLTAPLSDQFTNLHRHALFVPTLVNMALYTGQKAPLAYPANAKTIKLRNRPSEMARLRESITGVEIIPSKSFNGIALSGQRINPGYYTLIEGDTATQLFAFNLDRSESIMTMPISEDLIEYFEQAGYSVQIFNPKENSISKSIETADLGLSLWPWFIAIGLLFLIVETLLIKLLKT